jgi:hypothetical protein
MGIRKIKTDQGQPIEDFTQGGDGVKAVDALYKFGRRFPGGKPTQKDYAPRQGAADRQPPQPGWDEYRATYRPARNSNVSPAPDEQSPQFVSDKVADHNDVRGSDWTRSGTHPHFDRRVSGTADHKYRK